MSVSAINYLTSANYTEGSTRTTTKSLGQDDFLKLVLAEMTNQDPLNPQTNTEFIAQMAQFSSLEQAKSMQEDMASLRSEQQITQANALLGRTVALLDDKGTLIKGAVSGVQVQAGAPKLTVNGQSYALDSLISIEPATSNN